MADADLEEVSRYSLGFYIIANPRARRSEKHALRSSRRRVGEEGAAPQLVVVVVVVVKKDSTSTNALHNASCHS